MEKAKLVWRENQPFSTQFEDVYFSSDDGLAETDYVFLQGSRLAERWQQGNFNQFTIVETGFGTGLNFLCTAKLWLTHAPKEANLHFISIEKFPLSLADMTKSSQLWPAFNDLNSDFLALYQGLISGDLTTEQSGFLGDKDIKLTLLINDVTDCLNLINKKIDAWFLDGFAPAKNPDMWSTALFRKMAELATPSTTFATFTASSMVRRSLTEAGFAVKKQAGFGKKREMLTGIYMTEKTT